MNEYLTFPLSIKSLTDKKHLERTDAKQSIHGMLHLIATTEYQEVRHDPAFGCDIWKYDFENIYNTPKFKEDLKKTIRDSINRNEKRLTKVKVELQIEQVEIATRVRNKRVKTRIKLLISGTIVKTNEALIHEELFFIGPLSYD